MFSITAIKNSPIPFFHASNLITYLGLFSGFFGCLLVAKNNNPYTIGFFVGLSAIADMFDGKFARLFERSDEQKKFGAQIDSLADVVVFGIAPLIGCFHLGNTEIGFGWLAAATFYLLCTLTRLGHFNVRASEDSFIGVPTTMVGVLWSGAFLFYPTVPFDPSTLSTLLFIALGGAMIVPVTIPRPKGLAFYIYAGCGLLVALLNLFHPFD